MLEPMTLPTLQDTVSGSATARRLKLRLNPGGGPGSKVFPPTIREVSMHAPAQRPQHSPAADLLLAHTGARRADLPECHRVADTAEPIRRTGGSRY